MDIEVSVDPLGLTRCAVSAKADLQEAIRILESFPEPPGTPSSFGLLIDLRAVTRYLPFHEQFEFGVAIAKSLSRFGRVAIFHTSKVDDGLAALVARNRGVNASAFDTPDAAIAWLTEPQTERSWY